MKKRNKGHKPPPKSRRKPQAASAYPSAAKVQSTHRALPPAAMAGASRAKAPARSGKSLSIGAYASDDRFALALLLAPFLIVALSLAVERGVRQLIAGAPALITAARQPQKIALTPAVAPGRPGPVAMPEDGKRVAPEGDAGPGRIAALEPLRAPPPVLPNLALIVEPPPPVLPNLALIVEPPPPVLPNLALIVEPPPPVLPNLALIVEPLPPVLPSLALIVEPLPPVLPHLALIETPTAGPVCTAREGLFDPQALRQTVVAPPRDPAAFGLALATAAKAQLGEFVIYNPKYRRIAYPMGDVPAMFGVCSDVVVRAYRGVGLDLQALIQDTRSGRGDRNIDHRRVEVIRRFLTRHGETIAISDLPEDYLPGDIVSYYRPQNRTSTAHIAIVTDLIAPSGRPMIVHNRGWGPQLEDALFVDKITGHYRFAGLKPPPAGKGRPSVVAGRQDVP